MTQLRMKVSKRPDWNPSLKVTIKMTLCLRNAIDEATQKLAYINREEFIVDTLRRRLAELGIKYLMERP